MPARCFIIVAICVLACRDDAPLEKLAATGARTFDPSATQQPAPPPPPPGGRAALHPAPPEIAALVRDRFGVPEVTVYLLGEPDEAPGSFLGYAIERTQALELRDAVTLVEGLAGDEAFSDGMNGCSCGGVGVRIGRGAEHVDFIVDCGNVFLAGRRHVGTLDSDVSMYIDSLL